MTVPRVYVGDRSVPLAAVKERASRLASGLGALGIGHGDRYAIVLRNEVAFLEASLAGGVIGAIGVPVNWHWTGEDLRHLLRDSGAKCVIVHTDLLPAVEIHAPSEMKIIEAEVTQELIDAYDLGATPLTGRYPSLDDLIAQHGPVAEPNTEPPMGVIYTSGTTGLAKGILRNPIRSEDVPALTSGVCQMLKLKPEWRTLLPAPLYHTAPNVHGTFAAALGMNIHIMPRFDPVKFLQIVQDYRVDTVQMVPTMFTRLLQLPQEDRESYDLSSLKAVVHAAAPCPPQLKRAIIDWLGPIVHEYYGGSEGAAWVMCNSEEALSHPGSVGRPLMDAKIRIFGPDPEPLPAGEPGVIYGKSYSGWPDFTYIGQDEQRHAIERDGYITVGDIGYLDEDGFLYLIDRVSDTVISGGVNIYPAEIEACLHDMDGVADVAVFGIPDPDLGEAIAAHVELLPGAQLSADDVRSFVQTNLAKYKVPRVVVFDEKLPREDTGKLFKRRLKALYWPEGQRI